MNFSPSFGEWVRRQRRQLDLTQAALAAQVGCAPVTIRKIEQETRRPSREMAELLADHLHVPHAQRLQFMQMARGELPAGGVGAPAVVAPAVDAAAPAFVQNTSGARNDIPEGDPTPHFVARAREMQQLTAHLAGTMNGSGRVVFVTGEAGSGKTSLLAAFTQHAQELYPDLLVAGGNCDAFAGIGDPYLPFRDVLALLTGDVETKWKAGLLGLEQARRLWGLVPHMVGILEEAGPDLIDLLISGRDLIMRALAQSPEYTDRWFALEKRLALRRPRGASLAQSQIFAQYTEVLRRLARHRPTLILLDDLHWTDRASAGLLFQLGRRLLDARIMVIGAFRPDEVLAPPGSTLLTGPAASGDVAMGQGNTEPALEYPGEHPVVPILHEFKRRFGDIEIDLNRRTLQTGRAFVDDLLDQEPNTLSEAFRAALFARTEGHPLFTVEMLRDMQERGDLTQDAAGLWREARQVDWQTLPARVEAVIGRRLEILPDNLLDVMKIAAVEGETFTAEVAAKVMGMDRRHMIRQLSGILGRRYQLVRSQDSRRAGAQAVSRYRFGHILFQKYLYNYLLDPAERAYLHEAIGMELESLYSDERATVAVQLGHHFQSAGLAEKAVTYYGIAGARAVRLSAHEEAIAHFVAALGLLATLPATLERDRQEFQLRIALGVSLVTTRGWPAPETEAAYTRAYELAQRIPYAPGMGPALSGLYYTYAAVFFVRGQLGKTHSMSRACLEIAQSCDDAMLFLAAHAMMGPSLYHMGQLEQARTYTERGSQDYAGLRRQSHVLVHGPDLGVFCSGYAGHICWTLGYPDNGLAQGLRALEIAHEQDHPFSVVVASCYLAMLYQFRDDWTNVQRHAQVALSLCTQYEFVYYAGWASFLLGWVKTRQSQVETGLVEMKAALDSLRKMGTGLRTTYYLALMAEAHAHLDQVQAGLDLLDEGLEWMERYDECYYGAELYRLQGELLLQQAAGAVGENHDQQVARAHAAFAEALALARRQSARMLELRTHVSLCRMQRARARAYNCDELAALLDWFTEGQALEELKAARTLLAQAA